MTGPRLQKVLPGQPITADWANSLVDAIDRLGVRPAAPLQGHFGSGGAALGIDGDRRFDLVELKDTIQANDFDKAANLFAFDSAATPPWFQKVDGASANIALDHTADAMQSLYLAGERHLAYFHPAAGQRIPLPGVQFHIGKLAEPLTAGGSATVNVWRVDSGTPSDSGYTVTAYDWMLPAGASLASGTPVSLFQHPQSKLWFVFAQTAIFTPAYGGYWMNTGISITGLGLQTVPWTYAFGAAGMASSAVTYDAGKQNIDGRRMPAKYLAIASLHLSPGWTSAGRRPTMRPSNSTRKASTSISMPPEPGLPASSCAWDSGVIGYRWEGRPGLVGRRQRQFRHNHLQQSGHQPAGCRNLPFGRFRFGRWRSGPSRSQPDKLRRQTGEPTLGAIERGSDRLMNGFWIFDFGLEQASNANGPESKIQNRKSKIPCICAIPNLGPNAMSLSPTLLRPTTAPSPAPDDAYVSEDGAKHYVSEDGTQHYQQE